MSTEYTRIGVGGSNDKSIVPLDSRFKFKLDDFVKLMTATQQRTFSEEIEYIQELGGVNAIMNGLFTDAKNGIKGDSQDIEDRKINFGDNEPPKAEIKGFLKIFLGALDDFTLKILMVAALVSIAVSVGTNWDTSHRSTSWIEGFAIVVAIFISAMVSSINDYQKEKQFQELNNKADSRKTISVIRNGQSLVIHQSLVLVGDIVEIVEGMEIPADGIILQASEVTIDESSMTGETDPVKKNEVQRCMEERDQIIAEGGKNSSGAHDVPSPALLSGTRVLTGMGKYLILVVGEHSCIGKIRESLTSQEPESTPLQQKLENIARDIGVFGLYSAVFIIIVLCIRFAIERATADDDWDNKVHIVQLIKFFIIGVTVVVVAIPEGLPLSVTLSLAYSVKKMLNDQNLVRQMAACETMGGADIICSDKTGTLTQNKMTLTNIWNMKTIPFDPYAESINISEIVPQKLQELFLINMNVNSSATLRPELRGSKTEIAFLEFTDKCGYQYESYRDNYQASLSLPFSSKRKRMSVIVNYEGKKVIFTKGASEMILQECTKFHGFDDSVIPMTPQLLQEIEKSIEGLARQSLRTICIAYKNLDGSEDINSKDDKGVYNIERQNFTLQAILGIKDILREEVKDAIQKCYGAGISVRMVTGDNKITAQAIALDCKIIDDKLQQQIDDKIVNIEDVVKNGIDFLNEVGGVVCKNCKTEVCGCPRDSNSQKINGGEIRIDTILNSEVFDRIYPNLRVIARCRPDDKYAMVTGLRERGHIVAVTGDGTNDAPALKKADVGFAMGIQGTEVAREAAAIILLDDNFNSIVKAVMWGRNIYDAIRKFLQFQLTVNVVAVTITLVGAALNKQEVLQAIQMLWINLIMDTFASLALATEPPTERLLDRKPHNRKDYIVSKKMFKHIFGQAFLQCVIIFVLVFDGEHFLPEYRDELDDIIYNKYYDQFYRYKNNFDLLQKDLTNKDLLKKDSDNYQDMKDFYKMAKGMFSYAIIRKSDKQIVNITDNEISNLDIFYTNSNLSKTNSFFIKPDITHKITKVEYQVTYLSLKYSIATINNTYDQTKYVCSGRDYEIKNGAYDYVQIDKFLGPSRHFTYIFNTFVWLQIFNFINARKIFDEKNILEGILTNGLFLQIIGIIVFLQSILVTHGGIAMHVYKYSRSESPSTNGGLVIQQWLICIGFGATANIANFILKHIPENKCLQTGNKEVDPVKQKSGIMSIRRSESMINRQFTMHQSSRK